MLSEGLFGKRFEALVFGPQVSDEFLAAFAEELRGYSRFFAAVSVNLHQIPLALKLFGGLGVKVCAPIAHPLNALPTELKMAQAAYASEQGADWVDVHVNVGHVRAGRYDLVRDDLARVVEAVKNVEKVIVTIDSAYLSKREVVEVCGVVEEVGADMIRTNTGFGMEVGEGDVGFMAKSCGIPVIACGGIDDAVKALKMLVAGAALVATSKPLEVVRGFVRLLKVLEGG